MAKKKSSAAGPYLGFGLQTVRFCARLLSEPADSVVYVENDDDVSVHYANGERLLEQTKSGTTQNPVSDWAKDLWKTIHNWLTEETPSSTDIRSLCLYVTPAHTGTWVTKLHDASTDADVGGFLKALEAQLSAFPKAPACAAHVKTFLKAKGDDQNALVKKFQLIAQDDPLQEIRERFNTALDPIVVDQVISFAIGKAKNLSDQLLRSGQPGALSAGSFQQTIRDFVRHTKLPTLDLFETEPPDPTAVQSIFASRPIFIRQLELIELPEPHRLNAVSDFLHASSSKSKWASTGTLLPESLTRWNEALNRRHNAILKKSEIAQAHLSKAQLGSYVYWECLSLDISLDSRAVPSYFISGCLNDLADRKILGWHPNFQTLLK